MVTVGCNDRHWLVFSDLAHVNPLWRQMEVAETYPLQHFCNGVQHVILLSLTICNKYWDDLT